LTAVVASVGSAVNAEAFVSPLVSPTTENVSTGLSWP
jgi:hypothetical protein